MPIQRMGAAERRMPSDTHPFALKPKTIAWYVLLLQLLLLLLLLHCVTTKMPNALSHKQDIPPAL